MSDFSRSPLEVLLANQQKGYVGIHIEQGAAILDRDLNLLHDLVASTVRSLVNRYIGDGVPAGRDGFGIAALPDGQNTQNFQILSDSGGPGTFLVGGIEVVIPANTTYQAQTGMPALTTPNATQPDPRVDIVYLDVSLTEVDSTTDTDLSNSQDVGMQTSVRLKPTWVVRVAEGVPVPAAPAGHFFCPLARIQRPRNEGRILATMLTDLRQRRLTVSDMEQRLSLMERALLLPAFVTPPSPQFLPRSGAINQTITLNGANFDVGPVTVRFGDVPATIVGAPSATQIVARVPGGLTPAGTQASVRLSVTNPGGTVQSADTFTVLPSPAFTAPGGQFSPANGTPGTQVTINGFNFNTSGLAVRFGSTVATLVGSATATRIVAQVPTGLVPGGNTSANVRITVQTSAGTIESDDVFRADLAVPAPTLASPQFLPRSGVPGNTITINGSNFNFPPVSVRFDTVTATIQGSPSATQIVAVVPTGLTPPGPPRSVNISVTTAGGTVTSTDQFTVNG